MKADVAMPVQVEGIAHGEENTIKRLFRNHRAFVPANDLRRAVTAIVAVFVCPVPLRVVVIHPFFVNALHFLPFFG